MDIIYNQFNIKKSLKLQKIMIKNKMSLISYYKNFKI